MTSPDRPDESTPTAATDGRPEKKHGDPLLNAAQGDRGEVHGTRHGHDAEDPERPRS
jgi:hypothetical protein